MTSIYVASGSLDWRVERQPLAFGSVKRDVVQKAKAKMNELFPDRDRCDLAKYSDVILWKLNLATGEIEEVL